MSDRGASLVETVLAVTMLGVGATTALGALHTLTLATSTAHERLESALHLVGARGVASLSCPAAATPHITIIELGPCPDDAPRWAMVEAGVGQRHRHLTMIVDGGP